jgi:hypothetical protein
MHPSIGDFAESLIGNQISDIHEGKAPLEGDSTWADPDQPDVSQVKVPDNYSSQILQESFDVESSQSSEDSVDYSKMVSRLSVLITEAKEILENLGTTVGSIGVALGKSGGEVPKREPKISKKDPKNLRKRLKAIRKRSK